MISAQVSVPSYMRRYIWMYREACAIRKEGIQTMRNALSRTVAVGSRGQLPLSWKRSQGKLQHLEVGPIVRNSRLAIP